MTKDDSPPIKRPTLERTAPHRGPDDDPHEGEDRRGRRRRKTRRPDIIDSAYHVWAREMRHGFELAERRGLLVGRDLFQLAGFGLRALSHLAGLWVPGAGMALPGGRPARGRGAHARRRDEVDEVFDEELDEIDDEEDEIDDDDDEEGGDDDARDERDEDDDGGRRLRDERDAHDEGRREGARGRRRRRSRRSEELHVSLELSSRKAVVVTLDLDRDLAPEALHVYPLHALPGNDRPIRGAAVEILGEDRVMIRLSVPDDQPAGDYEGVVTLQHGRRRRVGQLRVAVWEAVAAPASKRA